jgi:hypothetical protein
MSFTELEYIIGTLIKNYLKYLTNIKIKNNKKINYDTYNSVDFYGNDY